jgi:hypothetical protein
LFKEGKGTLAYRDAWSLFDQVLVSSSHIREKPSGYYYKSCGIFKRPYMVEQKGKWKGYPKRSWDGMLYNKGYSDHFPVYILLERQYHDP